MKIREKKIHMDGSITVEASIVLPIFIFLIVGILYLNQFTYCEEQVQCALTQVAKEASVEYAFSKGKLAINPLYLTAKINNVLSSEKKNENRSVISMVRSKMDTETDQMDFIADYNIKVPLPVFAKRTFRFAERYYGRAFTGVLTRMSDSEQNLDQMVYITKTGKVYHSSLLCTHLKLSIKKISIERIEQERSLDGGKYYPCEKCCGGRAPENIGEVYICNYGNRYHAMNHCNKISRNIREIPISQVGERMPCKTCGKQKENEK